jgi:signal transduction histidine kinase
MKHDYFWITLTVVLDLSVAAGYVLIALHWWRNQKNLPDIPAKRALAHMRNIFAFCGICGYVFIPVKMFWPGWRLYDFFMGFLVYFTWRYALRSRELKVVYSELGRSARLAEDLHKSQEQAKRKSFFLNAISHDLRTPLNGLSLQSSVVEMSLDSNDVEGAKEALAAMRASTTAAAQLLDVLLDYSRLETTGDQVAPSEFQLAELLGDIKSRCHPLAEEKKSSLQIPSTNGMKLSTDRLKLDRILTNLVDNAIKFTPGGQVRVEVEQAGRNIEIHVIDNGVGIDPAVHSRLFEEFFQVHNHERDRRKGFGMGLAIAQRLARQLGGDIAVDSALGRGSRFSICLPNVVAAN